MLILYVLATSLGLIALKLGTKAGVPIAIVNNKLQFNLNAFSLGGIALYGLSFMLYIYLISKNDLGFIIPLTTGLIYAVIFTASYFVFRESFTTLKVLAILLIISGVMLLNLKK